MSTQPPQYPDHASPAGGPPRYTPGTDQYGAAGGRYGTGAYDPNQYTGTAAAPAELKKLLTLTLVSAGLYLLSGAVAIFATASTDMTDVYRQMGMPSDQAALMAEQAGGVATATSVITLVIAMALYALVYVFLKKGRNWARILGIVLAILGAVGTLFGFIGALAYGGTGIVMIVVGVLHAVANILWLVTAFKAPVARWFGQHRTA
jgi:hypothetical protein